MTRNNETSYREKGRAVFLAAIMLLSVVAVSTAFAGSAVATDPETSVDTFDDLGNELRYEGQNFNISDGPFSGNPQIYLAQVDETSDTGAVTSFGNVIPHDNSTKVAGEFNVEDLDFDGVESGTYVISNTSSFQTNSQLSDRFSIQEQDLTLEWDDDRVDDGDQSFIEIDSDNRPSPTSYNVTISADGLDDDQLATLFNVTNNPGYEVRDAAHLPIDHLDYDDDDKVGDLRDDDYITLNLQNISEQGLDMNNGQLAADELAADFQRLENDDTFPDAGEYEFEFIVTDTGTTATDSIQISESSEGASFSQGTYQAGAGDIAQFEFTLEDTDETWIQIGDESSDFVDVVYVETDEDGQTVELSVNTRLLGTDEDLAATSVYDYESEVVDDFDSAYHGGIENDNTPEGASLYGDDGPLADGDNFDDYVDALSIADQANESLIRPLQATDYEIQIAGTDVDSANEALFDADTGGEANDQLSSAVLELQPAQIGDITVHTAPEENADDQELEDLLSSATEREEVAIDDRLVVQVEASGIYGALVAGADTQGTIDDSDVDWDRLSEGFDTNVLYNVIENTEEQVDLEIEADSRTGNQDPLAVDLNNTNDADTYLLIDDDEDQFFVVADTSKDSTFDNGDAPEQTTSFTAEFEYDADNEDDQWEFERTADPDPFDSTDSSANYPYLQQGEVVSSSAQFDLAPRDINFDNVNVDEVLEAENVEEAEISGTTNVAPGSDATLRVSSTEASSAFRIGQSVNISEDGTVSATYDLSGQEVGDQFDTSYRVSGSSVDTVESVLVEEGSLGEEPPADDSTDDMDNSTDDMDDSTDDMDDSTDDSTDSTDDSTDSTDGETQDDTPGFGAVVALVAVLGAALLATRRQN